MDSSSVWLARELMKKIAEAKTELTYTLTSGSAGEPQRYFYFCGKLQALHMIEEWIKEADPDERAPPYQNPAQVY